MREQDFVSGLSLLYLSLCHSPCSTYSTQTIVPCFWCVPFWHACMLGHFVKPPTPAWEFCVCLSSSSRHCLGGFGWQRTDTVWAWRTCTLWLIHASAFSYWFHAISLGHMPSSSSSHSSGGGWDSLLFYSPHYHPLPSDIVRHVTCSNFRFSDLLLPTQG